MIIEAHAAKPDRRDLGSALSKFTSLHFLLLLEFESHMSLTACAIGCFMDAQAFPDAEPGCLYKFHDQVGHTFA